VKVALITDQHFGARNDSNLFLDYYEKFYTETFFPTLVTKNVEQVYILGDTFDRRKYINYFTLVRAHGMFFDVLAWMKMPVKMIIGNHDTYFKNTNDVNSPVLTLGEYDNIEFISHPKQIDNILFIPWICAETYQETIDAINDTNATICMGHLEIEGFAMYKGMVSEGGLSRKMFRKFDMTFSGHYHHKSEEDGIHYLGNPYQLTWQDYGDTRGFHILDTETLELEFIPNPDEMFIKLTYDDKDADFKEFLEKDISFSKNKYVKLVVVNKTNPYLFDTYVNNIYNIGPADFKIVEDFTLTSEVEDDTIDQAQDTLTILNSYVDTINDESIDSNKLKSILRELYVEALNLEQA